MFGQVGAANEVVTTRFAKPPGWYSNSSSSVSKVSKASGHTVGPNSLLKVMAGDVLNARTDYYYQSPVTNNSNNLVTDVVTTLVQAIGGSTVTTSSVKNGASGISTNLNGSTPFAGVTDPNRYTTDNIPRAYLNIVFFDERFNFVAENSTGVRVSQPGDGAAPLVLPANTKAPKNGYAYIYLSNENDQPVYFDNFQVSDKRGRIIEENHYYAFGLKIAGISSTKLADPNEGNINNKNLYNDKELIDEADLNWYDYGFRSYDAQIGRFPQLDPLTHNYAVLSPYQYGSNEPIANVDVDGLFPGDMVKIGGVLHKAVGPSGQLLGGIGSALGSAASSLSSLGLSICINAARIGSGVYNQKVESDNIDRQISGNNDATNAWILYSGQKVAFYSGDFGNTDNPITSFKGSSGILLFGDQEGKNIINDYRNAKYQFKQDIAEEDGENKKMFVGPLPAGNYTINLTLDPDRQAKIKNGQTVPGKGMEKITYFKDGNEYTRFAGWGPHRARLEADDPSKLGGRDGNFYFHDSHKGYTHGCIETERGFFTLLRTLRKSQPSIRVMIKYKSPNTSTNGGTAY